MGITYHGPYAEQVGYRHEGYAARRLPSGELTGTWTYATREFTGYIAVCACGWQHTTVHPPTEAGERAAEDEWERLHLEPMIERVKHAGWSAWDQRMRARAETVHDYIGQGRYREAVMFLDFMERDLALWKQTAKDLAERES